MVLLQERSKAVPDGAIAGYLRPVIYSRVAKYTYGIRSNIIYDANKTEHKNRLSQRFTLLCGEMRLPGGFWTILKKVWTPLWNWHFPSEYWWLMIFFAIQNTKVLDTQEFRSNFFLEASNKAEFAKVRKTKITCYRGSLLSPEFLSQDSGKFECFILSLCMTYFRTMYRQLSWYFWNHSWSIPSN